MLIPQPYLLFLGDVTDPLAAKTARGIHIWRPEQCVGEIKLPGCTVSLGLDELDIPGAKARGAKTLVLGTANAGGYLPAHWLETIKSAIKAGMNVASGLHHRLVDEPELVTLAQSSGVELFDLRHMRPALSVGSGKKRSGKRILTVGTDCSVGKMYTSLALEAAMRARGMKADFRATGQTGILVAGEGHSRSPLCNLSRLSVTDCGRSPGSVKRSLSGAEHAPLSGEGQGKRARSGSFRFAR